MIRFLLDTDTCVAIIKGNPAKVRMRLGKYDLAEVGISAITRCELEYGVAHSRDPATNRVKLDGFLSFIQPLEYPPQAAVSYGCIRSVLNRAGTPIGPLDTLIAAHALYLKATLVTHNMREFKRVSNLLIEDWC